MRAWAERLVLRSVSAAARVEDLRESGGGRDADRDGAVEGNAPRRLRPKPDWSNRPAEILSQPPPPGDHSGEVQRYKILNGDEEETICPANHTRRSIRVPAGRRAVSISAVTPYGTSPPADVPLRYSGT